MINKSDNPREKLYRKVLHGRWVKIVSAMASVVVFVTVYALILPAITLSNQAPKCNAEEHTHVAECYDAEGNVVCGTEEHVHNLACYSDLNAAIENEEYWVAELPELTGDRNADVIAVAKSQIGYRENEDNYIVSENDQMKGYTRYGHWFGDTVDTTTEKLSNGLSDYAYKDWDAMFVSFVLRYAEIYDIGFDSDAGNWAGALSDAAIYVNAADYAPQMGDLIFFTPNVGDNMRVGIVSGVNRGLFGNEIKSISVILGDSNNTVEEVKVAVSEYTEGDITFETIHGYGVLTPGYGEQEATAEPEVTEENENTDAAVAVSEETEVVVPEDESTTDVSVAEEASVSLEESAGHLIGQTEENLETVDEASEGEVAVALVDAGISEDTSEIVMNWNMTTYLPEAILPAGSIIRIDTSTGKTHVMTVGQVRDWAQAASVGADDETYVDNESFEVTFIGDNGLLYTWDDVQNMDATTVTSFTGIHIKALNDVALGDDGAISFGFASMAKVVNANVGQNYYVSKVTVNGVSGTETYVYTNGEAETVDQNAVLRDAGLEEKQAEKTLTAKKNDYTVTMTYGIDAGIPDGSKLYVKEIEQGTEEYNRYIEDAKTALDISEEDAAKLLGRFFDIKIITKDGEFEPNAPVSVNIEYKKAIEMEDASSVNAVHFSKEGAEALPVEAVDVSEPDKEMTMVKSVEFSAESFSVYGIVYTVDFETVDGGVYSIPGEGSYRLRELLPSIIGKSGSVSSADLKLVEGEEVAGALYLTTDEEGEYWINSDVAFDDTYLLTIVVDGVKYEIRVTDVPLAGNTTQISASVSNGTTVTYNSSESAYEANVSVKFVIPTDTIKREKTFTMQLGDDIIIPDNALGVVHTANDHGAGMESFDYKFVKGSNGKYTVEITFRDDYLNAVEIIGKNSLAFNVLIKESAANNNGDINTNITDGASITVPGSEIKYPENEDKNNNIFVDKSYTGTGTIGTGENEKTYIDYTVHVSTTKGTKGDVVLSDSLQNIYYKINGGDQQIAVESVSVQSIKKSGSDYTGGQFTAGADNKSFTYQLGQLGANEYYDVTYRYVFDKKLQESGTVGQAFSMEAGGGNTATATSGTQKTTDGDTFKIEKSNNPVTLDKSGQYNGDGKIEWRIVITVKEGTHTLVDSMLQDAQNLSITKEGGQGGWSHTNGTDSITFSQDGTYTITYKTDADPIPYKDQKIKNKAVVDNNPSWTKEPVVIVPHNNEANIEKSLTDKELVDTDGNIATYKLTWNVVFDLPTKGFPAGTVLKDQLSFEKHASGTLYDRHEFTEEQKNALIAELEKIFGSDMFDVSLNTSDYTLTLTFKDDWTNSNHLEYANITYDTTGYVDLDNINLGLSTQQGKDKYVNVFSVEDTSQRAEFTYDKEVNKIDETDRSGKDVSTHTITRDENSLKWAVVLHLSDNYYTMEIEDTLPKGVTPYEISIGGEYQSDQWLPNPDSPGSFYRVESHNKYMKENVKSVTAVKQADGTTKVTVQIEVDKNDPSARSEHFEVGKYFWTFIRTHVDESEFDPLENVTKEYTNNVSVTGDGFPVGDEDQTQKTTLDSKTLDKNTDNTRWDTFHEINYVVDINADGHAIMRDNDGNPIPNATYSLDDVLEFNKTTPDGKEINVMLVPGSVKLQTKNGSDWVNYEGDWTYQYVESKDGNRRFKTISLSGIPDKTPVRLVYAYKVDLDGVDPADESAHDLGAFINTVTVHGTKDYSYENTTENKWKNFDTSASSESSPTLTISKVDVNNYNKLLPGAKFILEYYDKNEHKWVARNAISQELMYLADDTPAEGVTKVYVTASSTNARTNGVLKIYQPYLAGYDKFATNTCYRVREYSAPTDPDTAESYMLSDNPDEQPCGYFWFSEDGSTVDDVTWPNERIKGLADDLSKESDTFYINNAKRATLKISKKFQGDVALTTEQKAAMKFEVYNDQSEKIATLTYDDIVQNRNTITTGIEANKTYTVIERVIEVDGAERVTTYTVNGGSDTEGSNTGDVSASVPIVNGIGNVVFTNSYETPKTSIKVTKKWLNDDNTDNNNPDQTTIKFQVYQVPEGASTGTPYVEHGQTSAKEYEITYSEGNWSEVIVDNLPRYADSVNQTGEYRYYAVETDPSAGVVATYKVGDSGTEGSAADAAQLNDDNKIVIVNREAKITVKKSFKNVFGQTQTDIPDGRTIHFKIVANATQTWDGVKTTQDIGSYTIRYNAAAHEWYKDGTNEVFAMKLPANKMEGGTVKLIYDSYFIVEEQENQFDISYLVNGLPLSNSNPIRNNENQEITIVNTVKAPEGEIIVRKEWMDINGQPEEAPVDSIDIKIKQVPMPIEGKGEPASIYFYSTYYDDGNGVRENSYKVGDIITVHYGNVSCNGFIFEGCTKMSGQDYGTNITQDLLITSPSVKVGMQAQAGDIRNFNIALSAIQLPTGTKEVTRELLKNPTNPDPKHPQAWVYEDRLDELFGSNPDVSLFRYQVEESGVPSDYKVTYTYGTSVDEDTMTGVANQGLITLTNAKVPPTKGSLKLKKEVTVDGGSAETAAQKALVDGDYTFSIVGPAQVSAEDQVTKYVRITVNNGTATSYRESDNAIRWSEPVYDQWAVVTDLLAGDYIITELTPTNGTAVSKMNGSPTTNNYTTVTVVAGDSEAAEASARATFTNNINTGDLKIEKKVTGTTATDKEFEFEVTLRSPTGTELTFATSYSAKKNGQTVSDVNVSGNKVTGIKLMANETFEILGLPEGTVYTVTEKTPLPQGYSEGTHSNNSGTIKKGPEQTATMNNKYEATGTLDFSAKKVFENGDLETQSFSFKLTQVTGQNVETPETDTTKLLLATNPVTETTTATSGTQQTVSFDTINLLKNDTKNQKGEYWFLLEEVLPSGLDSNNVKDGIKYDTTKKWIKVTVTDDGEGGLNVVKNPSVEGTNPDATFTNTKLKDFEFSKQWFTTDDPINPSATWPDGKAITVTVHRKVGNTVDKSYSLQYTINKSDLLNNTEIAGVNATDPKLVVTDATAFKYKLSDLEYSGSISSTTGEYIYYVTEEQVPDYKEPEYKNGDSSTTDAAINGGTIINRPDDAVTLPKTGGIGTSIYQLAGLITIVIAVIGIFLNKRRERWCGGCENK